MTSIYNLSRDIRCEVAATLSKVKVTIDAPVLDDQVFVEGIQNDDAYQLDEIKRMERSDGEVSHRMIFLNPNKDLDPDNMFYNIIKPAYEECLAKSSDQSTL